MKPKFYPPAPFRFRKGDSLRGQMMEMLRYLGLAVLVVCIAAFASGCGGGGGGGGATAPEEPPMVDPGPSDEERIAAARETIAGIVNDANTIEQAARSAVTAVESNADATAEQIANARSEGNAALDALREIVRASGVATTATTPAQAEGAVASARAALSTLRAAQTAAAGIQSAVEAVAGLREQQAEEDRLATNDGSRLIQHVRDNKLVYEAVIADLKDANTDPLTVGPAVANTSEATYPAFTGTAPNRKTGVRGVTVTPVSGTTLNSDSTTPELTGTGRLPHGFDLKSGATYVNAYTDINRENPSASTGLADDPSTTGAGNNEAVAPKPDADYLLAGIWLTGNAIEAFAYGGQPLNAARPADGANFNECTRYGTGGTNVTAGTTCSPLTVASFHTITNIVPTAGEHETATYNGDATGAYMAGGAMSYFEADVELTAVFRNVDGSSVAGSKIDGEVTNIVAAGKMIDGSIELRETPLANDISGVFPSATTTSLAVGVVAGESYRGGWRGQFFGQRISSAKSTVTGFDDQSCNQRNNLLAAGSRVGRGNV